MNMTQKNTNKNKKPHNYKKTKNFLTETQKNIINNEINNLLQKPNNKLKVGGIEKNIPKNLQEMFPGETFHYPRNLPGVYVIYFPDFNKVYVGQSKTLSKRVNRQTKGFSVTGSIYLNEYLKKSNFNSKVYALYQGEQCTDDIRNVLEDKFIKQAGENAINKLKIKNRNKVNNNNAKPVLPEFNFIPMEKHNSWRNYNLPYEKATYKPGEKALYAIINKDTKRLYIGHTESYPLKTRIQGHNTAIKKFCL